MTANEFAKVVRSGDGRLRVDKVILYAEGCRVRGQGLLRITPTQLELDLEVGSKSVMPRLKKHIWGENDFWPMWGRIEGDLSFVCDHVSPGNRSDHWGTEKVRTIQTLKLPWVDLKSAGWDRLTDTQKRKAIGLPETTSRNRVSVVVEAVLVKCEQIFVNAGTTKTVRNDFLGPKESSHADTFIDRAKDYDFALIQKQEDLEVHLRSKAHFRSKGAADDQRRFHALLYAVGFTHGFQPWPFRLSHWRDGKKVLDRIKAPRPVKNSLHAPFDKGLGHSLSFRRKGALNSPIRIASRFFENANDTSKKLSQLLFLARAGSAESVDPRVRTLALCSLFEGIVDLLFEALHLEKEVMSANPAFADYIRQRDKLCARLKKFSSRHNLALQRLAGSLEHAKAFRVKDKFQALCEHFHLAYSPGLKTHFDSWTARRNPMSHGRWDSDLEDFIHEARIAGAINIFVLKLMGYSGKIRAVLVGSDPSEIYRTI